MLESHLDSHLLVCEVTNSAALQAGFHVNNLSSQFPNNSQCPHLSLEELTLDLHKSGVEPVVQTLTCFYFSCLQRSDIVKAAYEPTDEECEWKADEEEELTVSKQVQVTYTPACFPSN